MFGIQSILAFLLGALSLFAVEAVAVGSAVQDAETGVAEVESQSLGSFESFGAALDRLFLELFRATR